MPFISDNALAKIQNVVTTANTRVQRLKEKYQKEETIRDLKMTGEALGAAAIMGYLRGQREEQGKAFNITDKLEVDIELAAGLGLMGAAYMNMFGKYDEDFASAGLGLLSHYVGQVARNSAKANSMSWVAGTHTIGADSSEAALLRALQG